MFIVVHKSFCIIQTYLLFNVFISCFSSVVMSCSPACCCSCWLSVVNRPSDAKRPARSGWTRRIPALTDSNKNKIIRTSEAYNGKSFGHFYHSWVFNICCCKIWSGEKLKLIMGSGKITRKGFGWIYIYIHIYTYTCSAMTKPRSDKTHA